MKLKYDWWGAFNRLRHEATPHPFHKLERALNHAAWFITNWADWAEHVRMQPAHLLRFDPMDMIGRGLAWRWTPVMDVVCFPSERMLVTESVGRGISTLFVYEFHKDGRAMHVFGERRREILGMQLKLDAGPTLRQTVLSHDHPLAFSLPISK